MCRKYVAVRVLECDVKIVSNGCGKQRENNGSPFDIDGVIFFENVFRINLEN